ncbi:MAG: N-acetylglucosamine-6-phosphate deacetylase [Prevotellaceae bacterium]|jgi:N-acetylglucosamine-6-phosphate deacetylase|nr:N-acetylglucosamine-6-phosphate deacetylase [Prevotellaceae bacterium]
MKTCIKNIDIYSEGGFIQNGSLVIDGEIISEIYAEPVAPQDVKIIDGKNLIAIPGYIDSHCHGGGGFDCNKGDLESILGMRDFYGKHGVTLIYPSLAANDLFTMKKGLESIRKAMKFNKPGKTQIGGCHLEGPFLNKVYKGSQAAEHILAINDEYLNLYSDYKDVIRRTTIAPEVEQNVEYFPTIQNMGIQISIGHSCATINEVEYAVTKGATSVTHLYNAMSQTKKEGPFRVGGVVEAALTFDSLYAEIIADGYHLPKELLQIAYKCKSADRLIICSDANMAAGYRHGQIIRTCGMTYVIERGVAMNEMRTSLASSISPIDTMVRHLIFDTKFPIADVLKMSSATVAKLLNIYMRKGSISFGKDADINIVDKNFDIIMTLCKGKINLNKSLNYVYG